MGAPLRILMVEDIPTDAELNASELRRAGLSFEWRRVETREEMLSALEDLHPDVVLCDYSLPGFSLPEALGLLRERAPDLPAIIVTGTQDEETAVECMRMGAWDYVLKEHLVRLAPAVNRALEQAQAVRYRKRAEEELRSSEAKFRMLVESMPDGLVVSDREGRILMINARAEAVFGYPRDELIGRTVEALVPEAMRNTHVSHRTMYSTAPRLRLIALVPLRTRRKDGSELQVEISLSPVETEDGLIIISVVKDITERTQLEEQVRQLQRLEAIGQLASGVAHDFNNLLTVILGRCALLLPRLSPDASPRRDIDLIQKTAERAVALTRQLLAFSRKQILEPRVLDLNVVVPGIATMLQRLIGEDIELVYRPGAALGRVKADPGQLEQVIMNLAVNARDAMPDGGRITIETENVELGEDYARHHVGVQPGQYVMLAVSDTGMGMDGATQARIFEPFFTTKAPGKGTGLGLSTVYGIVKQSGGNIWVYSDPGRGTTFKVYLPRVEDATEPVQVIRPEPGRGTESILLVEDEEEVRALAREVLEGYGYTVFEARDVADALLIAERHTGPIHLLVTDVVMPQMSGLAIAERLAPLRPEMKVLFMSGYAANAIVQHGTLDAGTSFVQKPFTPDALARKVREVLDAT